MDELEQQLKRALAREEPPAWFEAKVLAAAAREPERRRGWWAGVFPKARLRWATVALATLVIASGVVWQRERAAEERAAGEEAKAKLTLALRITSAKLHHIEQRVLTVQENN